MSKFLKYKNNILWVLGFIVVILLIVMVVQSVKAFHVILRENVDAIQSAGAVLRDAEVGTMDQEQYESIMIQYGSWTIDSIQAINGISENMWIYRKYELQNFENFIVNGVLVPEQDIDQMKKNYQIILQIQKNIQKAKENLWKSENGLDLFLGGKKSTAYYFAEIESICEAWSTHHRYGTA